MLTNAQRAAHAYSATLVYQQATNVGREDALKDLLASLMHLADEQGEDFEDALRVARMHHEEEVLLEE